MRKIFGISVIVALLCLNSAFVCQMLDYDEAFRLLLFIGIGTLLVSYIIRLAKPEILKPRIVRSDDDKHNNRRRISLIGTMVVGPMLLISGLFLKILGIHNADYLVVTGLFITTFPLIFLIVVAYIRK